MVKVIFVLLVIAACATLALFGYAASQRGKDAQGEAVMVVPIPTPTPQVMIPLEAFDHALDVQRDITLKSYEAIITIELAHAGVQITHNISWWLILAACVVIMLALLAAAK